MTDAIITPALVDVADKVEVTVYADEGKVLQAGR